MYTLSCYSSPKAEVSICPLGSAEAAVPISSYVAVILIHTRIIGKHKFNIGMQSGLSKSKRRNGFVKNAKALFDLQRDSELCGAGSYSAINDSNRCLHFEKRRLFDCS